jgi:hypothetical protein
MQIKEDFLANLYMRKFTSALHLEQIQTAPHHKVADVKQKKIPLSQ